MRIADVDRDRVLQRFAGHRHGLCVHRVGERNLIPGKTRLAHLNGYAVFSRTCGNQASRGFDTGGPAMEQSHRARGIAAGLYLAAVGIENAHAKIGRLRRFQKDQLIAADAGVAIGESRGKRACHGQQGLLACVQHDEVVSQPMHLDERNAHLVRRSMRCGVRRPVRGAFAPV